MIYAILVAGLSPTASLAAEAVKRLPCTKTEQPQQRQQPVQQPQQQRAKPQGCPVVRNIPPVVDPTPVYIL